MGLDRTITRLTLPRLPAIHLEDRSQWRTYWRDRVKEAAVSFTVSVTRLELALATAQENVDLSQDADSNLHSAEEAADLAVALLETGQPARAVELLLESAGGEELVLIGGSPRARYRRC